MHERFRNELSAALSVSYSADEIHRILAHFDSVSINYEFQHKQTELVPFTQSEIPQLVQLYIGCKKSEGLSDATLQAYLKILTIFFDKVRKPAGSIRTDEIRIFLYTYQQERNIKNQTLDKYREYICRF